jgi:hypothetical protein
MRAGRTVSVTATSRAAHSPLREGVNFETNPSTGAALFQKIRTAAASRRRFPPLLTQRAALARLTRTHSSHSLWFIFKFNLNSPFAF